MSQLLHRRHALGLLCGFPAAVAGLRYLQGETSRPDWSRKVIFTSDDAGMCKAVNEGTIQAMQHGIISSASIMTCCPEYDEFAEFAINHPEFDYGVHLVLTCDLREQPWGPVLGKQAAPSLIDDEGSFRFWPQKNLNYGEVKRELKAQIERAFNSGIRISHLDHHMWVMFHSSEMLRLYIQLGLEYNLPIRFCRTPPKRVTKSPELAQTYNEQLQLLDSKDLPVLDHIESDNYSVKPELKREYFLQQLHNLPYGISEIATHCSVLKNQFNPPDVEKRLADLEFFTSREAEEECHQLRLNRVDWNGMG